MAGVQGLRCASGRPRRIGVEKAADDATAGLEWQVELGRKTMSVQEISPAVSAACMRRLDSGDLAGIERHLLELDPVSRNCRFHSGFSDAAVAAYVRSLDVTTDILFGAIEEANSRIVGLAEARPAEARLTVDVGTSVLPTHRRRGVARELVALAIAVAFAEGMTAAEFVFDPTDPAAVRTAARLGAKSNSPGRAVLYARSTDNPIQAHEPTLVGSIHH
jgi:GNAT superfamily N-acetyltransferase